VETATPKERLQALVNGLTEEDADLALQILESFVESPAERNLLAAGIVVPPKGRFFAKFKPLTIPGPPTSELLIADRR
jgi:hypothetical protein